MSTQVEQTNAVDIVSSSNVQDDPSLLKKLNLQVLVQKTLKKCEELMHLNDDFGEKYRSACDTTWNSVTDGKCKENNASPSLPAKFYVTGQPNTLLQTKPNWIWIHELVHRTTVDSVKQHVKEIFPDKNFDIFYSKSKNKKKCLNLSMDKFLDPKNWSNKSSICSFRPFQHRWSIKLEHFIVTPKLYSYTSPRSYQLMFNH